MADADYNIPQSKESNEILNTYRTISNKLKKRFLRKPNVTEASEQFAALGTQCEQKELWPYAGFCWLAAARCQATLGNNIAETNFLTKAGRQFLIAEKKDEDIGCSSIGRENFQAAVSCFGHSAARNSQLGFGIMSVSLAMELAAASGPSTAGVQHLKKAISMHPFPKVIDTLVSYFIKQDDYVAALQALNAFVEVIDNNIGIANVSTGNYVVVLHRCEVTRVLLLLILQPTPQRIPPSLAQVLEKYAWIEDGISAGPGMCEDEVLLLQSLVLACQSNDCQALLELEGDLWIYLDTQQKELLRKLIQIMTTR
ncbi:factor VIII intron 22 protein [Cephus cinctus]|uniref:Factor VIII intron 22 protein n=1 Tax=Cephus cinctus TaxID=211228 RepID=A0AAJ7FHS5_CEPCN|nr:factor VIII intron 22 protein [Cephus cinctus]